MHFIPTEQQLADIFTKPLPEAVFMKLVNELGMVRREKVNPDIAQKNQDLTDIQEILTSVKSWWHGKISPDKEEQANPDSHLLMMSNPDADKYWWVAVFK